MFGFFCYKNTTVLNIIVLVKYNKCYNGNSTIIVLSGNRQMKIEFQLSSAIAAYYSNDSQSQVLIHRHLSTIFHKDGQVIL